ncbi:MAG: leucine--tRNA ligase [Candidatus Pacearchaeota archaeon]
MPIKKYNFKAIERKWQKRWEESKIFKVDEKKGKKKFYVLEMYPYPSGSGLHMGHAFNYVIGDIFARLKRMQGFNVLYPMGYDSFGLPAENAAIKEGVHPKKYTERAIENFIRQQKELGLSYDWDRIIMTHDPAYYKWNQFFFLKFFEKGLIYRKKALVNWCPKCNTVLANEQVHQGTCWRHKDTSIIFKELEQWFIKTTSYADELLEKIDKLEWPQKIKLMQKNWIGKSHGVEIDFKIEDSVWSVFTTRPETIFGVTFIVISAQHPRLMELVKENKKEDVEKFLKKINSVSEKEIKEMEKEGVFTGSYAVNPINNEKVPVYAANFVVADYGSGMVMGVPAHDERDFQFAKKYSLQIKSVIKPKDKKLDQINLKEPYIGQGVLINSGDFNGLSSDEAREQITKKLEFNKLGRRKIQYKFRDWLISRQRYWGTPIPIVYCNSCGIVPLSEEDLPILLPEKVEFGFGNPLETNKNFVETTCPKCQKKARRETDTMDTFFDSSWYYLRYCDNKNSKQAFKKEKVEYWMPVDQYIGGSEHATMHLIYARFFTKALRDLGFLKFDEPFLKLFNQGMLHGEDGFVMSKSRGNVVLPEEVSNKYGIDTARFFMVSIASTDKDIKWSDKGIDGSFKFIKKVFDFFSDIRYKKIDPKLESKINKTIEEVTENIINFNYNIAIIKIRELFYYFEEKGCDKKSGKIFLKLLHPFCPHITEELWERLGGKGFLSLEKWPIANKKKINIEFEKEEALIENVINDINNVVNITKGKGKKFTKLYLYVIPNEKSKYINNLEKIEKRTQLKTTIYLVNDKNKYDPESKSNKALPGKPGIYLE